MSSQKLDEVVISKAIIETYTKKFLENLSLDVAIAGGGPAGLFAAYKLAQKGHKVALFERKLSIGGGMWGGGIGLNIIVVQDSGKAILDELEIRTDQYAPGYYTANAVESVGGLIVSAVRAGAALYNLMSVEDVFSIKGRGTVVTGRVEQGVLNVGDQVEIVGLRDLQKTTVTGIEMFRKLLDEAMAGDNVGLLLRGIGKDDVERGQVIAKPGSITPHTEFEAQVYVLTKEEGGRHNPFFDGYRPQFYFRTTDVTGSVSLPEGTEMVMPGDNTEMTVVLGKSIAMDEGLRFAIREGGRTVGAGRVIKIIK